jgi:Protein of unknown function (DUF3060)
MCKHSSMDAKDDPEARIRELERSLGDIARASELTEGTPDLGAGQYGGHGNAPPLPPGSFGVQFPNVPPRTTGRGGQRALLIGVLTLVTVGIVGGAVVYLSNALSKVPPLGDPANDRPTISGGGGPFGEPPSPTGGDRPQVPVGETPDSVARPGEVVSVAGMGGNRTIACDDGIVSVSGMSNTVVVTGHCASVTVSGFTNIVTVDTAEVLAASGFDNRVTYRSGNPAIQNSGNGNTVGRG